VAKESAIPSAAASAPRLRFPPGNQRESVAPTLTLGDPEGPTMIRNSVTRAGKVSYGIIALLLGLPLPIVIIAFLMGGCNH
jgi:hypothetical protein